MRILGIDPGFGRLGYAILERREGVLRADRYGLVQTEKGLRMPERLRQIHAAVTELIEDQQPDCIATEAVLFAANRTTAFDVSKALGVVLLAAAEKELPWTEYTPPEIKQTVTGAGNADKRQVQFMVTKILGLREPPKPDDVADALAIAICHSMCARMRAL